MNCNPILGVQPQTVTLNHASANNFQQFGAAETLPAGCSGAVPALAFLPTWSTSDPADVSISNARNNTNGIATCLHATPGPVTVTATTQGVNGSPTLTGTATLMCN